MNEGLYESLKFHNDKWFEKYGVELMFNSEGFRIIHKRYFPYLVLSDQSKVEFDGLVIAQGHLDSSTKIPNLHSYGKDSSLKPPNVFSPFRNKR